MSPCSVCGFEIVTGGRIPDMAAQEKGYCGAGCEAVDAEVAKLDERMERQEGR